MIMAIQEFILFSFLLIYNLTLYLRTDLITAKSSPTMDAKSSLEFLQEVWFYPFVSPTFSLIVGTVKLHFSNLLFKWKRLLPRGASFIFPWHLQVTLVSSLFIPTETMLSPGTLILKSKCNWSFYHAAHKDRYLHARIDSSSDLTG